MPSSRLHLSTGGKSFQTWESVLGTTPMLITQLLPKTSLSSLSHASGGITVVCKLPCSSSCDDGRVQIVTMAYLRTTRTHSTNTSDASSIERCSRTSMQVTMSYDATGDGTLQGRHQMPRHGLFGPGNRSRTISVPVASAPQRDSACGSSPRPVPMSNTEIRGYM